MPEQPDFNQVPPVSEGIDLRKWAFPILAFVVVGATIAIFVAPYFQGESQSQRELPPPDPESARGVMTAVRDGDYDTAVARYEAMQNSEERTFTATEKARATWNVADARYKASGDVADTIKSIQELKKVAVDSEVDIDVRAQALSTVGSAYSQSGEHPAVFGEVFAEPPYSNYVVEGNPAASTRGLLELAHRKYPLFKNATSIASLYIRDLLIQEHVAGTSPKEEYIEAARRFMQEGERLIAEELAESERLPRSRRYIGHYFWRAFTLGGLAYLGDDQGLREYHDAYADLFERIEKTSNVEAKQYTPFANWMYATFLLAIEDDKEKAREHLRKAIEFVESDPKREVNEFEQYLRNRKREVDFSKNEFLARNLVNLRVISPDFDAFFEAVEVTE